MWQSIYFHILEFNSNYEINLCQLGIMLFLEDLSLILRVVSLNLFFPFLHKKVSKIGLLTNGLIASINIYQKIKRKNFQQTDTFSRIVPKFPRGSTIREISQFFKTC